MKELIFSIEDIFNSHNQDCCLVQYDALFYHIPAYQRGYKWSSEPNGAVSKLLDDLWNAFEAFERNEKKEYYLQYITVKRNTFIKDSEKKNCLEVIDGQQRLTTLSILFAVISLKLGIENISKDKLNYAIRNNFFDSFIYNTEKLLELNTLTWYLLSKNDDLNKQDLYYIFSATKKAFSFFESNKSNLSNFYEYLCRNVKLIVNSVEAHVESETVFKNLNSNKVPLTESELIKGLLITKIGRINQKVEKKNFKEILEIRMNLGRHWDEISRWSKQSQIETFYFNEKNGIQELLMLTALYLKKDGLKLDFKSKEGDFPLFNSFNQFADIPKIYSTMKSIQNILNDWFNNNEIYNLIGFCRFAKNSTSNNLQFLVECLPKQKDQLKIFLEGKKKELLSTDINTLRYKEHDDEIHAVLLALSVFYDGLKIRFNFQEFIEKKWSLEHIFPQSPEGKNAVLEDTHKKAITDMLGINITKEITKLLKQKTRSDDEKKVYYMALQNLSDLNSIGNMCLLTNKDNSSNGCMFFKEKRGNILHLIQKGSFVPKHTFDVFSKMMPELEGGDISIWTKKDINNHNEHILKNLK